MPSSLVTLKRENRGEHEDAMAGQPRQVTLDWIHGSKGTLQLSKVLVRSLLVPGAEG